MTDPKSTGHVPAPPESAGEIVSSPPNGRGQAPPSGLRRQKLSILSGHNWTSALRELAIIVFGVLIALGVNNWNERRMEARLEREYLSRIAEDLRADTAMFRQMLAVAEGKEESLRILGPPLRTPGVAIRDTLQFLHAIIGGATLAWNQPPVRRTTFDELENTGYLRLISDPGLRSRITAYYFFAADEAGRIENRSTGFGRLSYRLVPHVSYGRLGEPAGRQAADEFTSLASLSGAEKKRLVERARASELGELVQAEENFARFYRRSQAEVQKRAFALLREIEGRVR